MGKPSFENRDLSGLSKEERVAYLARVLEKSDLSRRNTQPILKAFKEEFRTPEEMGSALNENLINRYYEQFGPLNEDLVNRNRKKAVEIMHAAGYNHLELARGIKKIDIYSTVKYLRELGYDHIQIAEALKAAGGFDYQLISSFLAEHYDAMKIAQALKRANYDLKEINRALDYLRKHKYRPESEIDKAGKAIYYEFHRPSISEALKKIRQK